VSTNSSEDKSQDKKFTRRDFLKLAGIAGAVAILPSIIPLGKAYSIYRISLQAPACFFAAGLD